jgi:hypothetical protein
VPLGESDLTSSTTEPPTEPPTEPLPESPTAQATAQATAPPSAPPTQQVISFASQALTCADRCCCARHEWELNPTASFPWIILASPRRNAASRRQRLNVSLWSGWCACLRARAKASWRASNAPRLLICNGIWRWAGVYAPSGGVR